MAKRNTPKEVLPALTDRQLAALRAYAAENGRNWKEKLRTDWLFSRARVLRTRDPLNDEYRAPLQQVRNTFGPAWLNTFQFPPEKTFWTWNWEGGGYNSCIASSREEALAKAIEKGKPVHGGMKSALVPVESTLRSVSAEEMAAIDRSWAGAFD